jgi:uncharacterized protein (TIGR02594 family)
MRAIILSVWAISACAVNINSHNPPTVIDLADPWVGSHERYDRAELRDFLGVDPVRTEWCAAFVNSVLAEASIPGSDSVHRYPLLARSFLTWGDSVDRSAIQLGDVVIFPRGRAGWQGHVGFYVDTVWISGVEYWQILGGNQSNLVSVDLYPANRAIGIRRAAQETPVL